MISHSISVILPALNEEENIGESLKRISSFFDNHTPRYEIIVIDDGSKDKTVDIVEGTRKQNTKIKLLRNPKNEGYGYSLFRGIKESRNDWIFYTDSDLQFDIEDLKYFFEHLNKYDAILGYRIRRNDNIIRKINAKIWNIMNKTLLKIHVKDIDCAFKLFKRDLAKDLNLKSRGSAVSPELLLHFSKKNAKILELPVNHFKREKGKATGADLNVIRKAAFEFLDLYRKN